MKISRTMKLILVIVFLFSLFAGGFQAHVAAAAGEATVTVVGAEGTILPDTKVTFEENETALDVLEKVVSSLEAPGGFITKINDIGGEGTNYWAFYINGISSNLGAGEYIVQEGDHFIFHYEDWTILKEGVSIKVIGKNDATISQSIYPFYIFGQPTAIQLLQAQVGPANVGLLETDWGLMIDSINGLAAEGNSFWSFLVNGEWANVGAGGYVLQPGDEITFKYETYVPPTESPTDGENNPGDENNSTPSEPIDPAIIQTAIDSAITQIPLNDIDEWGIIALKRAGKSIPEDYLERVTKTIQDEHGTFNRITDYERYVLGILAAGGDPSNVGGYNLISSIYNGNVTKQGMNGVAYALIALDSSNFETPANATWTREKLVDYLLDNQNQDGSWPGVNLQSVNDFTAIVLTSLAPYKEQADVGEAIDNAVNYLSSEYKEGKIDNSMTAAQIIIALSSLKIDPNGALFTSGDGTSIISYLLSFQRQDKSFDWLKGGERDDFATTQAIHALEAYQLYVNGKGSLFDFTSFEKQPVDVQPVVEQIQQVKTATDAAKAADNKVGKPLPNTATNSYNLLVFGLIVILAGIAVITFGKRKNV